MVTPNRGPHSPPSWAIPGRRGILLGAACMGWLLYFSLTPFYYRGGGWSILWSTLSSQPWSWPGDTPSSQGFLPYLPLALAWLLALVPRYTAMGHRLLATTGVWLTLSLCGLVITLIQQTPMAHPTPAGNPWNQQIGIGLGILAGTLWTLFPARSQTSFDLSYTLRPLGWALLALTLFLPLEPHSRLIDLDWQPIANVVSSLPQHIYLLIKSFILWVPLGLVYGLGGRQAQIKPWVWAGIAGFLVEATTFAGSLRVTDLWEVAVVPFAVWAGLAVAGATRTSLQDRPAVPSPGTVRARAKAKASRVAPPIGTMPTRQPAPPADAYTGRAPYGNQASTAIQAGTAPLGYPDQATGIPPTTSGNRARAAGPTPPPASGPAALNARTWKAVLRLIALCLFAFAAYKAYTFPRAGFWLTGGLTAYALLLWRWPGAWLLLIPAALPLLDLAPWTGRFYFNGFDLVMLVSIAMGLWHGPMGHGRAPSHRNEYSRPNYHQFMHGHLPKALLVALACYAASWLISLVIGLLPMQSLDANAFSNYWSHWNSLRAGKGFLWALAVLLMLSWNALPTVTTQRLYSAGILVGLAGVSLIGLRERWLFAGLFDLDEPYRIVATFSSMHTGGGHIEAYLVMCIPFLWLWLTRNRNPLLIVGTIILLLLSTYVTLTTISRGGVAALLAGFAVLGLSSLRRIRYRNTSAARIALPLGVLLLAVGLLFLGAGSGYFQQRMTQVDKDWQTRVGHWRDTIAIMHDDWATTLFGMGLGRFPVAYLEYTNLSPKRPTTYRYLDEGDTSFLRLGSGETLYMAQRVPVESNHTYRLTLNLRSRFARARLETPLCEKQLLNSFQCVWKGVGVEGDNRWHTETITIQTGKLGNPNPLSRRPIELSLYNPVPRTVIDISQVRLVDPQGRNLIHNGDFGAGGDYWFFKTHDHLPWHIKNLLVEVLFEQGWLGLLTFLGLMGVTLRPLVGAAWGGDDVAAVVMASASGFLVVGLFGSLFDNPRLSLLFFSILFIGLLSAWGEEPRQRRSPTNRLPKQGPSNQ